MTYEAKRARGRPRIDNPQTRVMQIRLHPTLLTECALDAARVGVSLSAWVKDAMQSRLARRQLLDKLARG
jgi:predicted HicB family RNase H-like nuclease